MPASAYSVHASKFPWVFRVLAALALTGGCGHASMGAEVETHALASVGGKTCLGYFTWHGPAEHVVIQMNGTGTRSNAFLPPGLEGIVRDGAVLYATLDRPGIRASFGAPVAATTEDAVLEAVTQTQLLACARDAVHQIAELFGPTPRFHLRGHSEGALLSSSQLDVIDGHDGGALRAAVSPCDWPTMRDHLGVSCAYLEDAYAQPSGRELFERLAEARASAQLYLFHGTQDWNAKVEPVRDLEAWAQSQPLALHVTYYEGGHNDPPASTRQELNALLISSLTKAREP